MQLKLGAGDERASHIWGAWLALAVRATRERALWLALLLGALAIAAAYQSPRPLTVDIGGNLDAPDVVGFYEPESNALANYRWSQAHSAIIFPGAGKPLSPATLHLQLSGGPKPSEVKVTVNGHPAPPFKLTSAGAAYAVTVDPDWVDASGDVRIDFTAPTFRSKGDRRDLGFLADLATLDRASGLVLPSLTQMAALLACGALFYLLLRGVWLTPRGAGLLVGLFLLGSAALLAAQRLLLTGFTGQLLVTLLIALLVTMCAEAFTRWLVRLAGWRGRARLPEWSWAMLRGLVAGTVALKVGGLLYPLAFIIDASFHLKYVTYMNEVLFYGRSWQQYFGESLAFAVMPKEEWGSARAFIPYSPFFYVVATPLAWLPLPLTITVPVASGIMEALKVALVFIVGLALGKPAASKGSTGAARVATITAAIYAFIPATFLLQQFGNWPTLTSLWLLTAWAAIATLFWQRITAPAVWLVTTGLLTLTLVSYTVTAVYTGIFVGLMCVLGLALNSEHRRRWLAVFLSLLAATALSLLIYYGQYVDEILNSTLPTFENAARTQGSLSTLRPGLYDFLTNHLGRAFYSYDLALPYAVALAGALFVLTRGVIGKRQQKNASARQSVYALVEAPQTATLRVGRTPSWQRIWIGAWLLTFPLFTLADYYVDQAFKEFWYALPAVALVSGVWLLSLARRGAASRPYTALVWLLGAVFAWQSISLWVFRLLFHNR